MLSQRPQSAQRPRGEVEDLNTTCAAGAQRPEVVRLPLCTYETAILATTR